MDSIESTFTLDGCVVADQEMLTIEQLPEGLSILISKANFSVNPDLAICGRLADIIGIDVHTLFNFASQPPETIEQLMRIQNIPEMALSTHDGRDHPAPDSKSGYPGLSPAVINGVEAHTDLDGSQLANGLKLILNNDSTSAIRCAPVMAASIGNQPAASADFTRLAATIDASSYVEMASQRTSISEANNHPTVPITAPGIADVGETTPDVSIAQPTTVAIQKLIADERSPKFQITGEQVLTGVLGESFVRNVFDGSHTLANSWSHRCTLNFSKGSLNLDQKIGRVNGCAVPFLNLIGR